MSTKDECPVTKGPCIFDYCVQSPSGPSRGCFRLAQFFNAAAELKRVQDNLGGVLAEIEYRITAMEDMVRKLKAAMPKAGRYAI